MARRVVGLSGLSRQQDVDASYEALAGQISSQQLNTLQAQMSTFQSALRQFATKHRAKIVSDAEFRHQFSQMCAQLGVDPLGGAASSSASSLGKRGGAAAAALWDLIGVGDWTYALGVQVVDVCLSMRERNGGLIEMDDVLNGVERLRHGENYRQLAPKDRLTEQDITRALKALEPLGCGYTIITVPSAQTSDRKMVRCVPQALDTDSLAVLECIALAGKPCLTASQFARSTEQSKRWPRQRAQAALDKALEQDGLLWMDAQTGNGVAEYWMPSMVAF